MERKSFHIVKDAEELANFLNSLDDDEMLQKELDNIENLDFILHPPVDGADSDVDDAPSDDETIVGINELGKKLLAQPADIIVTVEGEVFELNNNLDVVYEYEVQSEELMAENLEPRSEVELEILDSCDDVADGGEVGIGRKTKRRGAVPNKKKKSKNWSTLSLKKNKKIDHIFSQQSKPDFLIKMRDEEKTPLDLFKDLFDPIIEQIVTETIKYAHFRNDFNFTVTAAEIYVFFGILIVSSYVKVPSARMYWEQEEDTFNILIANSMSRNRYYEILKFLHFNDNETIDKNDRLYKIRPLITHFNEKFAEYGKPFGNCYSLDEAMEPYYGRHSSKQFIRGKPIRFGFKFWCLTTSEGYLLKFDPYTGKSDRDNNIPLGSSVAISLCKNFVPENSFVFMDNYFTSLPLLEDLKKDNINIVGTIRKDRVEKAPLVLDKVRGLSVCIADNDNGITLIRWNDSGQVTMATNASDLDLVLSETSCMRYSKRDRKKVSVSQPNLVHLYNRGMGGVDLFDQQRGLYRVRVRSRKWYWPYFRFMFNGSIVNIWMLYRMKFPKISLIQFMRRIAKGLLVNDAVHKFGMIKISSKRGNRLPTAEVRYDGNNHLVRLGPTQRRCGFCPKTTKFVCGKCNIALHPNKCFADYHTKK